MVILAATALLAVPACKSSSGTAGSSTPAEGRSTASAPGPPTIDRGGSFCEVYKAGQPAFADLYHKATRGGAPAEIKAALDGIDEHHRAWAAAAPSELRDDFRVLLAVWQHDRELTEQAGWTTLAYVRALASDIENEEFTKAIEHVLTYLSERCHIDLAGPLS